MAKSARTRAMDAELKARARAERERREAATRYGYEITVNGEYEGTVYGDNRAAAQGFAEEALGHTRFTLRRVKLGRQ